ncbi:phosphopeptide binding protein [Cryptosporidium ubiquitum]|uniref:Phosphopeptide binding protein n=1 Tax=Cryptosporidium ubiquitum TaxID=857276 RepID=A0A1J4MLL6_9CRYT|nr:phosphopeptide binding protein [Cryptosporidium ubiquitum]OII74935.1 phosphopeptide binding protein [Cryptosporidium ubiquitum]
MVLNKKDAIQIIKKYFETAELNSKIRWDEAARLLGPDAPHDAFKVLSTGEKRQLWSEYQSQSKRRKRERERQTKSESINTYCSSLNEWVLRNQGCNRILLFRNFAEDHYKSIWWNNIEDKEKDEIFQEIVEEHERNFINVLKPNYEKKVNDFFELLKLESDIFPSFEPNNAENLMAKNVEDIAKKNFTAFGIWEDIQKKYGKEQLFNEVYKNDIIDIYIRLLKEKITIYKQGCLKTEIQLCKYRRMFWDIIWSDILSGKISPITKNRKNYFFTNSKIMDEKIETLCRIISKRIRHQKSESYFEYFEDFLKFIGFHLSIRKDQEVILALLKQPMNNGMNLYCIDMFEYIVYLLQKLYDIILSESYIYFKSSEKIQISFQQFKEITYSNQNIMDFKTKYIFPFSFESVLDKILYKAYCDEFKHYSLSSLLKRS